MIQVDFKSDKQVQFQTALDAASSPYSWEKDKNVRVIGGIEEIPWMDVIQEKDKNGDPVKRTIRYIASATSIYLDEQIKEGYSIDYGKTLLSKDRRKREDFIKMKEGSLSVSPNKKSTLVKYLMATDANGSKPDRDTEKQILFYFNDPVEKAKSQYGRTKKLNKARGLISDLEGNYAKQQEFVTLFNLDSNSTEEQILNALFVRAEADPELIINSFSDSSNTATLVLMKAEEYGIVELNKKRGYIYRSTDDILKSFAYNTNHDIAFKATVKYLQSDSGSIHFENLKKQIEGHKNVAAKEIAD